MANAYACDRCGELFKLIDYAGTVPIVLESDREIETSFGNSQIFVSLCPTCRAGFQKWWDEGAVCKTTAHLHRCNIYEVPEDGDEDK